MRRLPVPTPVASSALSFLGGALTLIGAYYFVLGFPFGFGWVIGFPIGMVGVSLSAAGLGLLLDRRPTD